MGATKSVNFKDHQGIDALTGAVEACFDGHLADFAFQCTGSFDQDPGIQIQVAYIKYGGAAADHDIICKPSVQMYIIIRKKAIYVCAAYVLLAVRGAIPATSRVAMLTALEHYDIQEYPIPELGDDDILVKVEGCGVCGTDAHEFKRDPFGLIPLVLGHEGTGEIVKSCQSVYPLMILEVHRLCRAHLFRELQPLLFSVDSYGKEWEIYIWERQSEL